MKLELKHGKAVDEKPWQVLNLSKRLKHLQSDLTIKNRKTEDEFTKIDVKNIETGERFMVADW